MSGNVTASKRNMPVILVKVFGIHDPSYGGMVDMKITLNSLQRANFGLLKNF